MHNNGRTPELFAVSTDSASMVEILIPSEHESTASKGKVANRAVHSIKKTNFARLSFMIEWVT